MTDKPDDGYTIEEAMKVMDEKMKDHPVDPGIRDYVWALAQLYAIDGPYDSPFAILKDFKITDGHQFVDFVTEVARPMTDPAVSRAVTEAIADKMPKSKIMMAILEFGLTDGFVAGLLVGRKQAQDEMLDQR